MHFRLLFVLLVTLKVIEGFPDVQMRTAGFRHSFISRTVPVVMVVFEATPRGLNLLLKIGPRCGIAVELREGYTQPTPIPMVREDSQNVRVISFVFNHPQANSKCP